MVPSTLQLVTFRLDGLPEEAYRANSEQVAPLFAAMPDLQWKVWLADASSGLFGGVYAWRNRSAMEAYVDGEVFGALRATPGIVELTSRSFDVLEPPTRITTGRGMNATAA